MKLGIVTDSTSDLPKYLAEQHEIEVIPTILILDGDGIRGRERHLARRFLRPTSSLRTPPTTAAPSIGDFASRVRLAPRPRL
ncbi:MAG: DegV family protein [Candidatus Moduliflexus flocculans]|nr:DegV family protein [Candidatus Moduliflexus flocculans]